MNIDSSLARYGEMWKTKDLSTSKAEQKTHQEQVNNQSFKELFNQKLQDKNLTFSKHAEQRLSQRNINLSDCDIAKLNSAVNRAEEKGVSNSLILMEKMAFIINIPSNVVVTAMSDNDLKENVFTKIDGVVIL